MSNHGRSSNVRLKTMPCRTQQKASLGNNNIDINIRTEQCNERSRLLASEDRAVCRVRKSASWNYTTYEGFARDLDIESESTHDTEDRNEPLSCRGKCFQCCCSSRVCFKPPGDKLSLGELSMRLRKQTVIGTKAIGSTLYNAYRLTRLGRVFSEIRKYLSFLIQVAFFVSSVISFLSKKTHGEEKQLLFGGMIISFIAVVLESLNVLYHWYSGYSSGYRRIRTWCRSLRETSQHDFELENSHEISLSEASINLSSTAVEYDDPDYHCFQRICKSCPKRYAAILDLIHVVMIELIFYPQLILSILKFDVEYINDSSGVLKNHWETLFRGLLSFANTLFTVYICRVLILIGSLVILARARNQKSSKAKFHIWFIIYTCCQMGIHVLMITMIGIRFHQEYHQADEDYKETKEHLYYGNFSIISNETINYAISYNLWYMMAIGYVYPVVSTIMFFVTYQYWAQKFILDLYIRLAQIMRKPGFIDALTLGMREGSQQQRMVMYEGIKRCANRRQHPFLSEHDLTKFYKVRFKQKFFLPFTIPFNVILCFIYTGTLICFMVCFLIHSPYSLNSFIFVCISLAVIILVNLYAFIIVVLYIPYLIFNRPLCFTMSFALVFAISLFACDVYFVFFFI